MKTITKLTALVVGAIGAYAYIKKRKTVEVAPAVKNNGLGAIDIDVNDGGDMVVTHKIACFDQESQSLLSTYFPEYTIVISDGYSYLTRSINTSEFKLQDEVKEFKDKANSSVGIYIDFTVEEVGRDDNEKED